ncbi:DUF2306 domain-containing protein [Erythrobacter sp. JK5]|uniref:DUF2306 domain-containing protein n=1 Tax=Erythrobacter sp. JK5 TaxID=2829500 RepID=UPI0020117782|nr:DUF2306 domain-containing protein [Erythrobacter sp. JK5]
MALVAIIMTTISFVAIIRGLAGIAPAHANIRELAIVLHVATVLPAIPLGGYLLLARKGGPRHKSLGKVWIGLMLVTATCAIFIGRDFSWIHLFVPLTFWTSWKTIQTARARDLDGHRKEILGFYLGALTIPGIVAFAIPGRLMNVWLFW